MFTHLIKAEFVRETKGKIGRKTGKNIVFEGDSAKEQIEKALVFNIESGD